jgi:hypothetical protein
MVPPNGSGSTSFTYTPVPAATVPGPEPSSATSTSKKGYTIGETGPAGGIIFYDKGRFSDGWRYMEAWTADEPGTFKWKTSDTTTGGTSTAIGTGYTNTYTAMAGTTHPAAQVARDATHGGKTDWFLPSRDELNQMYIQRSAIGGFASGSYCSSSEYGIGAWGQILWQWQPVRLL